MVLVLEPGVTDQYIFGLVDSIVIQAVTFRAILFPLQNHLFDPLC